MKRFVTILTAVVAIAAIVLAIVPTTFADETDEWFDTNDYHIFINNQRCDAKMEYDNGTIVVIITNPTYDYKVECRMWVGKNQDEPAAVGTLVKFILPDGTIYYDRVNERGKYGFYSNEAKANTIEDGYDENGNATMLSKAIAIDVSNALTSGDKQFTQYIENDIEWAIFEKNMKARIEQWHYNPVPSRTYAIGPTDIDAVINAAKGTRYENLIAEYINKVEAEKAAYYNEPEPITPVANTVEFADVAPTHWANANIKKAAKIGAFSGYEDGTFRPENQITHGEFIKAVIAIVYDGDVTTAPKATTTWAEWAQPYLNAAFQMGIMNRDDVDILSQGTPMTRAEVAKIATRVFEYFNQYIDATNDADTIFNDLNTTPNRYKPFIAKAYTAGILAGYEDGTFRPDNTLTRAEAAAIITRIADIKTEH